MRTQQSKRGPKPYPTTWHLGKRQPRTLQKTSWLGSLYKPAPSEAPLGKRSAIPNEWNLPWDNVLTAPQGFRFNEARNDLFNRDLIYKRAAVGSYQANNLSEVESSNSDEQHLDYAQYRGLMDDASLYPPQMGL